MKRQQCW